MQIYTKKNTLRTGNSTHLTIKINNIVITIYRIVIVYNTCPHISLVALHTGTGLILAEHAHIVGLSALQVAQITVGQGVVTFSPVPSVCCNTHCEIGERSTGSLPCHRSRV